MLALHLVAAAPFISRPSEHYSKQLLEPNPGLSLAADAVDY
jgi:hypothetical protein